MTLRAVVFEQDTEGSKAVYNVMESEHKLIPLLKRVKRGLAKAPPPDRNVTIQVTDLQTSATVHEKPWTVPSVYVG
jgi:hypothetical protein